MNPLIGLATQLIELIRNEEFIAFTDLEDAIPAMFGGNKNLGSLELNLVVWPGLSDEGAVVLEELGKSGVIILNDISPMFYVLEGAVPELPLATAQTMPADGYKTAHWYPGVLVKGPQYPRVTPVGLPAPSLN